MPSPQLRLESEWQIALAKEVNDKGLTMVETRNEVKGTPREGDEVE